ncbi:MAG TPA: DnaJ domain-containing protein [Acidimicrobiales bacterium]|nr:DnaJ domain-containing protein [Acidimicrobiales bacterium]
MTHYEVLGLAPDAGEAEVRRAYLALARRHHPDVVAGSPPAERADAERRMREVNEAWRVLGDRTRRAAYDRRLAGGADPDGDAETSVFRPFEPGDDDPDPLDVADHPYRDDPAALAPGRRIATVAPIALFAASVGAGAVGLALGSAPLLGLAVALFVLSCVGFLVVPLLALARATRDEG